MNARQGEDEDLITFTKRVKQLSDVVKSMIGTKILHECVKGTDEYKNASPQEMIDLLDNSYEHLGAYVLLHGADRAKYGNLMKGFVNQFLLKNDQYPKTLSDAVDALSNHPFDQGYYDRKKKRKEEAKKRGQKDKEEKETSFKPSLIHI